MKKFEKLCLITIIPILVGVALFIAGAIKVNEQILRASVLTLFIGFPATILVLVIVGVIMNATGKLSDNDKYSDSAGLSEEERDFKTNRNIVSSSGNKSITKKVDNVIKQTNNAYKYSSPKQVALGGLFFSFLIIDFILIFVFSIKQMTAGIITCVCVLVGSMFSVLIFAKVKERKSTKAKVDISKSQMLCGEVKACMISSAMNIAERKNVTFRVLIEADGKTYTAFSQKIYEVGDPIVFAVIGNNKASIVETDKFIKEADEVLRKEDSQDSF